MSTYMTDFLSKLQILRGLLKQVINISYLFISKTLYHLSIPVYWIYFITVKQLFLLINVFIITPLSISIRNVLQLFTLPVNIPLKIFMGTSIQNIVFNGNKLENAYILVTLVQYSVVLILFGFVIGFAVGFSIAIVHSFLRIPNVYIDVPQILWRYVPSVRPAFNNFIAKIYGYFQRDKKSSKVPVLIKTKSNEDLDAENTSNITSSDFQNFDMIYSTSSEPSTLKREKPLRSINRLSVSNKEDALEVASLLPSNFFQDRTFLKQNTPKRDTKDTPLYYQTPTQSPSSSNDTYDEEEDSSVSNIWDQFDDIPTTLRTEDDITTFLSRRVNSLSSSKDNINIRKINQKK